MVSEISPCIILMEQRTHVLFFTGFLPVCNGNYIDDVHIIHLLQCLNDGILSLSAQA